MAFLLGAWQQPGNVCEEDHIFEGSVKLGRCCCHRLEIHLANRAAEASKQEGEPASTCKSASTHPSSPPATAEGVPPSFDERSECPVLKKRRPVLRPAVKAPPRRPNESSPSLTPLTQSLPSSPLLAGLGQCRSMPHEEAKDEDDEVCLCCDEDEYGFCECEDERMDEWGWFEPQDADDSGLFSSPTHPVLCHIHKKSPFGCVGDLPPQLLGQSLSTQALWQVTGGALPRKLNSDSEGQNETTADSTAHSSRVVFECANTFGTSVSKAFCCEECGNTSHMTVRVPKYRVMSINGREHAEFLVVTQLGGLTFAVWKRHTDFENLYHTAVECDNKAYPNSMFSWRCMNMRKPWFRCLTQDYLSIKCFLLERFVHDCICESDEPSKILNFIGF